MTRFLKVTERRLMEDSFSWSPDLYCLLSLSLYALTKAEVLPILFTSASPAPRIQPGSPRKYPESNTSNT